MAVVMETRKAVWIPREVFDGIAAEFWSEPGYEASGIELYEVRDDGSLIFNVGDPPRLYKVNAAGQVQLHRKEGVNA